MPDSPLDRANRAASGIVPKVRTPAARTMRIYAKPAGETLATLARVRDRRVARARANRQTVAMPGGGGFVNPLNRGQSAVRTLSRMAFATDRAPPSLDGQMTGAILGQFIAENAAGRTAVAREIVAFVGRDGARHGMDALLLTALLHLEATKDAGFAAALGTWRATMASAGSVDNGDSGVVFDPKRQGLVSVDSPVFRDPFAGGVCAPAVVDHMQSLRGRDVGIGAFAVMVVLAVVGAAKGAFDAAQSGAGAGGIAWGAIAGAGNAVFGAIGGILGRLFGFATQDVDTPTSVGNNPAFVNVHTDGKGPLVVFNAGFGSDRPGVGTGTMDNGPKDASGMGNVNPGGGTPGGGSHEDYKNLDKGGVDKGLNKDNQQSDQNKDKDLNNDGKGGTGGGGDDTGPGDVDVPPADAGFPSPDDDGGSPWSLVAAGPMLTMSAARGMIAANTQIAFTTAQMPGLVALQGALEARAPLLGQLAAIRPGATLNAGMKGNLATVAQTIGTQFSAHPQIAPVLTGVAGRR